MKYTLAVAAILGAVSASQIEHGKITPYVDDQGYVVMKQEIGHLKNKKTTKKTKSKDKPSDEICDGDSADDRQLETNSDKNDDIVEDTGFSASRGATVRAQVKSTNYMMSKIESMSNAELNAMLNARFKAKSHAKDKPSDYLCDGDSADNKEISDTADPEDTVVEDFGFSGSRNARGQVRLLQTGQKLNYIGNLGRYSNELANGDSADDKELQHEADPNDDIVDINGFTNRPYAHVRYEDPEHHYAFDNAHFADNNIKNLFSEHFGTVPREDVTFSNGWVQLESNEDKSLAIEAPESKSLLQVDFISGEYDFPINKDHMNLLYSVSRYSDGIANGDHADDKDLESEADPKDMIVDFNGYSNHGYAHTPYDDPNHHYHFDNAHFADNNIKALFPDNFGTTPREDVTFSNGH